MVLPLHYYKIINNSLNLKTKTLTLLNKAFVRFEKNELLVQIYEYFLINKKNIKIQIQNLCVQDYFLYICKTIITFRLKNIMNIVKQVKIWYYICSYGLLFFGKKSNPSKKIAKLKISLSAKTLDNVQKRVNYYCKINSPISFSGKYFVKDLKKPITPKAYYFDTYEYARYFDENQPVDFVFGDVTHIPDVPSIVKSRPISGDNRNSVLLNLDKVRHFVWVKDDKPFTDKKNLLIGRGAIYQPHRYDFYQKYFNHPLCDLGAVGNVGMTKQEWLKPKISIKEHLDYKFVLSLQGNDVATNLKWIMSSNSIAVMPKPTIETWFMEGTLVGGKHYIELKSDYSDLEEQLNFYIAHPEKCLEIIQNAHQHCEQFGDKNIEDLCSLLVLEKYFNA